MFCQTLRWCLNLTLLSHIDKWSAIYAQAAELFLGHTNTRLDSVKRVTNMSSDSFTCHKLSRQILQLLCTAAEGRMYGKSMNDGIHPANKRHRQLLVLITLHSPCIMLREMSSVTVISMLIHFPPVIFIAHSIL